MSINKVEIQDSVGNVYYPHTDASVVKYGDDTVDSVLSKNANKVDSLVPTRHIFGGQLAKLKESLCNPLEQYTRIVFIGDSITWGSSLPENATSVPRDGTLSDVRDAFVTPSFVNEFKRYIGKQYANGATPTLSNWSASPSGESIAEYTVKNTLYPRSGDFTLTKVGDAILNSDDASPNSITGYQLQLTDGNVAGTSYQSISFKFTGDTLTLSFGCLDTDATYYDLYVDGARQGTYSTHANVDGFVNGTNNNCRTHTFNYVRNKVVEIRTNRNGETTGNRKLRFEGIIINKKIRISNQGINGATSSSYKIYNLTGNTFNDGEAVEKKDNYVFIQFGTNDRLIRLDTPKGTSVFKENIKSVIDIVTPLSNVILMCANPVTGENTSAYSFTMQGVRNILYQLAKENNLDMIDNYAIFNKIDLNTVLSDGLHPNKFGHEIIARNIINSVETSLKEISTQFLETVANNAVDISNLKQKSTSLFAGDYTTTTNGVITLTNNITDQNKIFISFGGGGTKTWNTVITCGHYYPSKFAINDIITVTFTNLSFVPSIISFKITASNQLTVLDGTAEIRFIKGMI